MGFLQWRLELMKFILALLLSVCFCSYGQNQYRGSFIGDGSGLTNKVRPAQAGLGFDNSTNWIPAGAAYDNGSNPDGRPRYLFTLPTNTTFLVSFGTSNDLQFSRQDLSFYMTMPNTINTGTFSNFSVFGYSASSPVGMVILAPTNTSSNAFTIFQRQDHALHVEAASTELNTIVSVNQIGGGAGSRYDAGTTLALWHAGANGYCDIGFHTLSASNFYNNFDAYTLRFAIGVGSGTLGTQFPYDEPFLESYLNANNFWFVGSGQIFGGFRCKKTGTVTTGGDWVWYYGGNTNTPMVVFDRDSKTISNYVNVVFNVAPTIVQTNIAPADATTPKLWFPVTNNGTVYLLPGYK